MGFLPNPGIASAVPGILLGAILQGVDFRKLLWAGLYACLALSVLSAVTAAVAGSRATWQAVWTLMVWSGLFGVWVFVNRGARTPREVSTALPMILTGVAAICWTLVIWDYGRVDRFAGTGGILLAGCAITAPALMLWGRPGWRQATRGALLMQLAGMACWLADVWGVTITDVSIVGLVLQLGSISFAANFVWPAQGDQASPALRGQILRAWKLAVLLVAVLLLSVCFTRSWSPMGPSWRTPGVSWLARWLDILMTIAALASTLSIWLGMRNVMAHSKAPAWARRIHLVVQALVLLLGLAITYATVWEEAGGARILERVAGALTVAVLAGLALSMITEVVARMHTIRSILDITIVRMQCPACQTRLNLKPDGGVCTRCGLQIRVLLRPTICLCCHYPLDHSSLKDTCPECGTPFRHAAGERSTMQGPGLEGIGAQGSASV